MAFPQRAAHAASGSNSGASPISVSLPTGIVSGSLLVIHLVIDVNPTTPSGWTVLRNTTFAGGSARFWVAYRFADGSEGSSVAITAAGNGFFAARVTRYTGHHVSQAPEITTLATGTSTAPNPGSLNPGGWDVEDTLWEALCGVNFAGVGSISAFPANYSSGTEDKDDAPSNNAGLGVAYRELSAASDDPGTFTLTHSKAWGAATLAVRPAPAAANAMRMIV